MVRTLPLRHTGCTVRRGRGGADVPWKTRIVVRLAVEWSAPDGGVYQNVAVQLVTLRWFQAVDILTVDDSQAFGTLLDRVARDYRTPEAAPIEG